MKNQRIEIHVGLYQAALSLADEAHDKAKQAERAKRRALDGAEKDGLTETDLARYIVKNERTQ